MAGSRGYRALLRLLPAEIRARFGRDMEEVFLLRITEAHSPLARAWVWGRAVLDVAGVACREAWTSLHSRAGGRGGGIDGWMQDLRYALRALGRAPAFSALVVGTLAVGVGTSTATFSVVSSVMLKPLPYDEPDRLVAVWPEQNFNTAMVRELLAAAPALESATGMSGWRFTLTGEGEPLQVSGARVSPEHFRVLGVRPILGRDFAAEDALPGSEAVTVIAHALWVRAFGSDPALVGRTIDLATNDRARHTVIGVLPPEFRPVHGDPEVWIPLVVSASTPVEADSTWYVNDRVGRLAPGATLEQANGQVRAFARDMHARMDQAIEASMVELAGVRPLRAELAGDLARVMWAALGAVSLVLLIACANVANLLLARGEARQADLAVRVALGAGRRRVARLLLVESTLLGAVGGGLGIVLTYALVRIAVSLAPADFPRLGEIRVDGPVLAYGLLATLTSAVLAGLVPALRASRVSAPALGAAGRSVSSRRGSRLATTLVGAQLTLAMVVVVASGLMLRSLVSMTTEDPGLDGRGVLVLRPSPPEGRYPSGVAFHAYYDEVLARVRALPAVESASAIHLLPGTRDNWNFPTFIDGVDVVDGEVIPAVNIRVVWPEYFETVGMGLQQGRTLLPTDNRETEPVVVVNQAFVDRFWPGEAALGRELRLLSTEAAPHRVVGVVRNVRQHGFGREPLPEMYFSHGQLTWNMSFWIAARVRDDGAPLAWADEIRSAVWSVDPDVPIGTIDELSRVMGASAATTRFSAAVLGAFGALALLLSAVGVFGVTAQGVGRRIPEFGVRIALGASRAEMVGAALGGTAVAVVAGLGAGILVAALSTEALSTALYEVEPTDPMTFAGVACLLLAVATLAALIPAWRAARVDPVTALKDAP